MLEPGAAWLADVRRGTIGTLPRARTARIESIDAFHSFFPMEIIATEAERARFAAARERGWRAVAEHRDYPIRMRRFIPKHWADEARPAALESRALRDEYFTFQVGVVAGAAPLEDVTRRRSRGFPAPGNGP